MKASPVLPVNFDQRPILVFWESTKACLLSCKHCRAEAIREPLPGELSTDEGKAFIRQLLGFGKPYPVLIITGGDPFTRSDLFDLVAEARNSGLPVALSPSVTPLLTPDRLIRLKNLGVSLVSISLDGGKAETHESIRGVEGHFAKTMEAIRQLVSLGFTVQVNTTVMRGNVEELADIGALMKQHGVSIWEVFFLIKVGRGRGLEEILPEENDAVCHFLFDASQYGFIVRTVEAPFFRRVVHLRKEGGDPPESPLYARLLDRLHSLLGPPSRETHAQTKGTRDGKGIIFVSHKGDVYPAGFLPVQLGNVMDQSLVKIYRESPLLQAIRAARFGGKCGMCDFKDLCGGSRARAFANSHDPLGEDPACPYLRVPGEKNTINA